MDDNQLLRYSRQIMLPQVGVEGQQRLRDATVLILGLGGLGSPVSMYLSAAGVGHLVISDFDNVDLSNLQRQVLHSTPDIGRRKVDSAQNSISALNPEVRITPVPERLTGPALWELAGQASLVVDCSDNFTTRFEVNKACVETATPLVTGAVIRLEGQISVFQPAQKDSPCYRCLYSEGGELEERCSETGILAPMAGIIGSIQANEALKLLLGIGITLTGRVLVLDALSMEFRTLVLKRDPSCPVCSERA